MNELQIETERGRGIEREIGRWGEEWRDKRMLDKCLSPVWVCSRTCSWARQKDRQRASEADIWPGAFVVAHVKRVVNMLHMLHASCCMLDTANCAALHTLLSSRIDVVVIVIEQRGETKALPTFGRLSALPPVLISKCARSISHPVYRRIA